MRTESLSLRVLRLLGTGFGAGRSPVAPGTVGTLLGIPLFLLLAPLGTVPLLLVLGLVVIVGLFASGHLEEHWGLKDPGVVVIDEVAGYLLTMAGSPADMGHILAGFFLFRFFDILKPFPVRRAEEILPGGVGIMMDDLLAGCYAWLCLRGLEVLLF